MNPQHTAISLILAVCIPCPGVALVQSSGGDIEVKKSVIAGGSATSSGGNFHISATAGQHDAGASTGGRFTVQGGFWPDSAESPEPIGDKIFHDGFENSSTPQAPTTLLLQTNRQPRK